MNPAAVRTRSRTPRLLRLSAVALLPGCVGVGVLVVPGESTDADDSDRTDDTDAGRTDSDNPPAARVCAPRELAWRAANAPAIGLLAGGGIAWHPTTGLRTWGGVELLPPVNAGPPERSIGFGALPWAIPAERWRSLFHTEWSPCMVHRDGRVDCRDDRGGPLPELVSVLGSVGNKLCWMDPTGHAGCLRADVETVWPSASSLSADLVSLAHGFKASGGDPIPFVCALDSRGLATCDGPSDLVGPFDHPDRCWVELVGAIYGLCGIDDEGLTTCRTRSILNADFADDTPTRRDLSHLSVSIEGACALDPEGHVVCWGPIAGVPHTANNAPPQEAGFVDLVVSSGAACALSDVGKVVCWGDERDPLVFDQPDRAP